VLYLSLERIMGRLLVVVETISFQISGLCFIQIKYSGGSGSKLFDPGRVGSANHLWVWETSPKSQISPVCSKKIALGWLKKYPDQRRVGPLFTAGQKYARVGSGQRPSLLWSEMCWSSCFVKAQNVLEFFFNSNGLIESCSTILTRYVIVYIHEYVI